MHKRAPPTRVGGGVLRTPATPDPLTTPNPNSKIWFISHSTEWLPAQAAAELTYKYEFEIAFDLTFRGTRYDDTA